MRQDKLPEAFIHYVWQTKSFNQTDLKTSTGKPVNIIRFGNINHNAGPDFLNASINIGDQLWVGNVEMHTKASNWFSHKHQHDKVYDSVILHVVWDNNVHATNTHGLQIPTIELKTRVKDKLIRRFFELRQSEDFIPCQRSLDKVTNNEIALFKERLMLERLAYRCKDLERQFLWFSSDWHQTIHAVLLMALGLNTNKEAFETLARITPFKLLTKYTGNCDNQLALLFGQAGFLHGEGDSYFNELKRMYRFLSHKHKLNPMRKESWRFSRMRPAQFPTIRIAQYQALLSNIPKLITSLNHRFNITELSALFTIDCHAYWDNHYVFNKTASRSYPKVLSSASINLILINGLLPFVFFYAQYKSDLILKENCLEAYRSLKAEDNVIIKNWKKIGLKPDSSFDTQSLLHLYKNYCKSKKCLQCRIGHTLLMNTSESEYNI